MLSRVGVIGDGNCGLWVVLMLGTTYQLTVGTAVDEPGFSRLSGRSALLVGVNIKDMVWNLRA